ncbi:glycerate kinase [Gordonia zhaorongruii]|uniref:glycerate kinase family protein n=1 Tax=Gordonia zhaorongruii TaxID=2597659 RepID=UPI00104750BF|nr:glycerate kinase [Gordonia zhaorongruii]
MGVRVVVAPDEFGGTMSAARAAAAIAEGWRLSAPADQLQLLPQSDGGPGFVAVLAAARVADVQSVEVSGPLGNRVHADYGVSGTVYYLEAAQACGLALLGGTPDRDSAVNATTAGVGELIDTAVRDGATRIVVGLGGSATTDGGRGALEALGGPAEAAAMLADVELVVATDVSNPLLGPDGAAAVFGPQKGADEATVAILDARLSAWADVLAATCRDVRDLPGAGAAGGLGAALLAAGGRRRAGAAVVAEAADRAAVIASADVVVTGEGRYDAQTAHGKVIAALAGDAESSGVPVLVLAGQVDADTDIPGVTSVWSVAEYVGSVAKALADPEPALRALARQVALEWHGSGVERHSEVERHSGA